MADDFVLPFLLVVFLGIILERARFFSTNFVNQAIELNYRASSPIIVLHGVINDDFTLYVFGQNFCIVIFLSIILFVIVYALYKIRMFFVVFFEYYLSALLKISMPMGMSFAYYFLTPDIFCKVSIAAILVFPATSVALAVNPDISFLRLHKLRLAAYLYLQKFILHPVTLAGAFGVFVLNENLLIRSYFKYLLEFLTPVILPFCSIVFGAKLSFILRKLS